MRKERMRGKSTGVTEQKKLFFTTADHGLAVHIVQSRYLQTFAATLKVPHMSQTRRKENSVTILALTSNMSKVISEILVKRCHRQLLKCLLYLPLFWSFH